jgi:hypothetical protein
MDRMLIGFTVFLIGAVAVGASIVQKQIFLD